MADPEKKHSGAESPTTARELDFDDHDDAPQDTESSKLAAQPERNPTPVPKRVSFQEEEAPPAKPPRTTSPMAEAEATLIEAFPSLDGKIIKAVLTASGGKLEPAFNALLGMSDPDFVAEQAPPQPLRPARKQMSQLEADEMYARQLAEQYNSVPTGFGSRGRGDPPVGRRRETGLKPNELHDDDHSFWDQDLPEIKRNLQMGFQETQKTVNKWITDFKKRLDGDEDEDEPIRQGSSSGGFQRQNYGPSQSDQLRGIQRSSEQSRRSGDHARYDADPHVLGEDFGDLQIDDDTPPRRPPRPQANPDLFKPTPAIPQGPIDEVDALYRQPSPLGQQRGPSPSAGKGGKKWQPLTSVAPAPVGDDNDPFSLGDSDEEETKKNDIKPADSERLKKSASNSVSEVGSKPKLEEADKSGEKDKVAEELLTDDGAEKK